MRVCFFLLLFVIYQYSHAQDNSVGIRMYNFNSDKTKDSIILPTDTLPSSLGEYAAKGDVDSLKAEILKLRKEMLSTNTEISNMQMNLYLCHKKYRTGVILFAGGLAAYLLGGLSAASNTSGNLTQEEALLILGGFGSFVTGTILMINAHKYIGKAGAPFKYKKYNRYNQNTQNAGYRQRSRY